jgi:hypothetical protein
MKKLVLAAGVALAVAIAPAAYASDGPGCGVGTMILEGQSGLIPQVLAVSTNATFINTFAVTSGTSGCSADDIVLKEHEREVFAAINFRNLKTDMAMGHGEYLTSLAILMGVADEDRLAFSDFSKSQFASLMGAEKASPSAFLSAFDAELANHSRLARYVPVAH